MHLYRLPHDLLRDASHVRGLCGSSIPHLGIFVISEHANLVSMYVGTIYM